MKKRLLLRTVIATTILLPLITNAQDSQPLLSAAQTNILRQIEGHTKNTNSNTKNINWYANRILSNMLYSNKKEAIIKKAPSMPWSISIQLAMIRQYLSQILNILSGKSDSANTSGWIFEAYNQITQKLRDKNNEEGGKKLQSLREKMQNLVRYGLYQDNATLDKQTPFGRPLVEKPTDPDTIILNNSKAAAKRKDVTADTLIGQIAYADNIGKKNAKVNKSKEEAAETFLQNIGANIAYPALKVDPESSEEAAKYISYEKAAAAMQSAVINNLVDLYAEHLPVIVKNNNKYELASRAKLFDDMNTMEIETHQKTTLAQNIASLFFNIRAMNYSFNKIANDLDKIVLLQSIIATQNNFMNNYAYENLRGMAERAAEEEKERVEEAKELVPEEEEKE